MDIDTFNKIVDEAVQECRDYAGCSSVAQICHIVSERYSLPSDVRELLRDDVEFWYGRKKG